MTGCLNRIKDSLGGFEGKLGSNIGYFYGLLAYFFYAIYDFKIRDSRQVPTFQLMFYRAFTNIMISSLYIKAGNVQTTFKTTYVNRMLILRSFTGVASTFFGMWGFQRANLSEATALNQVAPVVTAFLGVTLLKESYDIAQIIVTLMSVLGVFFIVKPESLFGTVTAAASSSTDQGTRLIGNFAVLASATFFAIGMILARTISTYKVNSQVTNLYAGTVLAFVAGPGMTIYGIKQLSSYEAGNVLIICLMSFMATFLYLRALNFADAGKVALMSYTEIPFGYLFDILFFGNVPDIFSSMGVILIFSCLFVQIFKGLIIDFIKTTFLGRYNKHSLGDSELIKI